MDVTATTGAEVPGRRINVIGTSGTGKTTFARALAVRLGYPWVELGALNWEANWQQVPDDVMRGRVASAAAGDAWVIDGNYSISRDLLWARADTSSGSTIRARW